MDKRVQDDTLLSRSIAVRSAGVFVCPGEELILRSEICIDRVV